MTQEHEKPTDWLEALPAVLLVLWPALVVAAIALGECAK